MDKLKSILKNIKENLLLDTSNIVILLIGTISAISAFRLANDPNKSIHELFMLCLTIVTIVSSVMDTVVNVVKIRKDIPAEKVHLISRTAGIITLCIIIIIGIFDNNVWKSIQEFSKRGGFTMITATLLMFKIAESRIALEIIIKKEQQEKLNILTKDKKIRLEENKKLLEENKTTLETNKKLLEDNKKLLEENKKLLEDNKKNERG